MIDATMHGSPIRVRAARPADRTAIERVAAANDEPTTAPSWPGFLYLDHLLAEATLLVAETDGTVVGFAGAALAGGRRPAAHITDLFVDPARHGQGVGGQLIAALRAACGVDDWTTCSSSDRRAQALYLRSGLRAWWPVVYLLGVAAGEAREPDGLLRLTPAAAAALELSWSGRDFTTHYGHWAGRPGGFCFRTAAGLVGVLRAGRTGPGHVLDHAAIAPDADPVEAVLDATARLGTPGLPLRLSLPGPSPALPRLLERGFRIDDADTFCATDSGLVDPTRVVIDPSLG
jgi:GNAT superfamily N-acetyltransferase